MNAQTSWTIFFGVSVALTILSGFALHHFLRNRLGVPLDNASSMFRELCRTHDLSGHQRRLVWRLACKLNLASPGALFVDSSLWRMPDDEASDKGISEKEWHKLLAIQRMLFQPEATRI